MASFSSDPSLNRFVIGWATKFEPSELHIDFKENPAMKKTIGGLLKDNCYSSSYFKSLAQIYQSGWMHIADGRALSIYTRTPEPDDILGTVLVQDGQIVEGSLQLMPTHRLLTVNGIFQLPGELERLFFQTK